MTASCTSFHLAAAAGLEASLQRITSARLSGTPAASKLESSRVKFSSISRRDLAGLKGEARSWLRDIRRSLRAIFGRGFFRETDGFKPAFLHLAERFLPPAGFKLAFGQRAVELKRFILKQGHGAFRLKFPRRPGPLHPPSGRSPWIGPWWRA